MIYDFVLLIEMTTLYIHISKEEGKYNKNNKDVCMKRADFVIHYSIYSLKEFISRRQR